MRQWRGTLTCIQPSGIGYWVVNTMLAATSRSCYPNFHDLRTVPWTVNQMKSFSSGLHLSGCCTTATGNGARTLRAAQSGWPTVLNQRLHQSINSLETHLVAIMHMRNLKPKGRKMSSFKPTGALGVSEGFDLSGQICQSSSVRTCQARH